MKRYLNITGLLLALSAALPANATKAGEWNVQKEEIRSNWQIQSSAKAGSDGTMLSGANATTKGWYAATVPGSILGSLVNDGIYKDIFYGRNLEKIPESLFNVPWWYRTTFTVGTPSAGQVYRLRFNGISYRADIWLNGKKIASSDTLQGSFRQFVLEVTPYIRKGTNVLALEVTRAGAGELSVGFVDWNPEPADHNMGIWRDVELLGSGPVSIAEPFVETQVDTATLDHAAITISARLHNHSGQRMSGELRGMIGNTVAFSQQVTIPPYTSKEIRFTPSRFPQLKMDHPRLWWVHTLGKPNLYDLHLQFYAGKALSDNNYLRFGIREVSDYITKEGHRGFRLNGKKILVKGGGWTDPMFLNATPAYESAGIDYAVHMNLNAIRMEGFWGHDQHIYDLCDEKGILIMAGFSCQWEWSNLMKTKDDQYSAIITPEQNDIAAGSWQDQVIWLRNHPSIFLWLYGSDKWPRPTLEKRYLDILKKYDPTRPSVSSAAEHTSVLTGPSAVKMRGPYDYVPPMYWYADTTHGGAFGFNTETGPGPEIPVLESLKKMIPNDSIWPIGSAWMYHAARGAFHNLTAYNRAMDNRLGAPKDLEDYLRKAQYLNYEGMRAMYEAFEANRFRATGIIQWMYNASWPKLWWQLYDYYLMPTGAFYGAQSANEPLHISYNYGNNSIDAMNNTSAVANGLSAEVRVFDFDMKPVFHQTISLHSLPAQATKQVVTLPSDLNVSTTWFLDLRLYNTTHQLISTNFYVLSTRHDELDEAKSNWYITPQSQYADLTMLQQLPMVTLDKRVSVTQQGGNTRVTVKLKNPTKQLAFMVYLDLKDKTRDASVTPVFWGENYFTLLPGEERTISGYCHSADLHGDAAEVTVGGWNVK
ncbi:glycoside hydrolase family 2 protein [Microbacter margulisiae]|uniref:Exo-1,4-beta-D-glucosaminidase n=1 Tax=Microbacter margulisiae TaxID=1350067 RepID=A0A7W5DPE8_9PORP|nr:sugar-binding domain-containing protein [Microbacter margulisiae]MBB3186547.1 exo-1,4-beta-D-glucosaminidase [Microbacter margulisiae]MBB3188195.1 exo-1,4-beta-D-glucosaminidase [Microbacter margulisiae]